MQQRTFEEVRESLRGKVILVANRGIPARRISRSIRERFEAIAAITATDIDKTEPAAASAQELILLGADPRAYLDLPRIIRLARERGCVAIHPGWGFASEDNNFPKLCAEAGITFIGATAEAMHLLGNKVEARRVARSLGIPVVPGSDESVDVPGARKIVHEIGLPIMLKAEGGGGGRGIFLVTNEDELEDAFEKASAMAEASFGNPRLFVEKYLPKVHHIEIQVIADRWGNVFAFDERDCSVQRRNQKLVEEAPAPFLSSEVTDQLETYSRRLFEAVDYEGLGTCEFMVTEQGKVYFLEVNPRLQVEHTVSEEVCGLDLVREQLTIANGGELTVNHPLRGHSFELRLTCEDPAKNLAPSSGTLTSLRWPSGPGIRVDSGVVEGDTISPKFDSMMGKLVVTASDRAAAVARVRRALSELTPASLFEQIFNDDEFTAEHGVAYDVSTKWLERKYLNKEAASSQGGQPASMSGASEVDKKESSETFVIEVNNRRVSLTVPNDIVANLTGGAKARDAKRAIQPLRGQGLHHAQKKQQSNDGQSGVIASPMQAVVTRINVAEGQQVAKGDLLVVLESMKMENYVYAPVKGAVTKIFVGPAAGVEAGETLMTIDVTGANGTKAGENGATGAAVDGTATDGTMEGGK